MTEIRLDKDDHTIDIVGGSKKTIKVFNKRNRDIKLSDGKHQAIRVVHKDNIPVKVSNKKTNTIKIVNRREYLKLNHTGKYGDSAYQTWLNLGNVGTEQDFIDSMDGTTLNIKGTVNNLNDLPITGNISGDGYFYTVDGHFYVWNGIGWDDIGKIEGPPGPIGPQGLDGRNGRNGSSIVAARFSGNNILFTKDDETFVLLYNARVELKGGKGDNGDNGDKGDDGASIVSADFVGNDIVFTKDDATTVVLDDAKIELKGDAGNNGTVFDYTPEDVANKVTTLTAESTDIEYPSAKIVYDSLGTVMVSVVGSVSDLPTVGTPEGKMGYVYGATEPDIDSYVLNQAYTYFVFNPNPAEPDVLLTSLGIENIHCTALLNATPPFELYAYKDGALGHQFVQLRYYNSEGFTDADNFTSCQIFTWVWEDITEDYIGLGTITAQNYITGCNKSVISKTNGVITIITPTAPNIWNALVGFGGVAYFDEASEGLECLGYYVKSSGGWLRYFDGTYTNIFINPIPIRPAANMHAVLKCGEAETHRIDVFTFKQTSTEPYFIYFEDYNTGYNDYYVYAHDAWTGDLVNSGTSQILQAGWNRFSVTDGVQSAVTQITTAQLPNWNEIWKINLPASTNIEILGDCVSEDPLDGTGSAASYIYQGLNWKPLTDITGKEDIANKVTTISASSTNIQYPTAKCVYDTIEEIVSGISATATIVTDIRDNSGQLEKKTQLLTFANGLLTTKADESEWTAITDI